MNVNASGGVYRAALIGCGKIGSTFADDPLMAGDVFSHAEAYHVCPRTELVAVVDADPDALEWCGSRWGVAHRYGSAAELLAAMSPDIVSVATPTSTHFDVMRELLKAASPPRAIICEKPIASDVDSALELVRLAEERGSRLCVMHMRRYARNMQNLRRFLRDGGIGQLRGVTGWLTKGTLHNGTHWFDLLRYLAGEVDWVSATNTLQETGEDPTLDVTLGLQSGILATMRAVEVTNFTICEMDIMGTTGRAQIIDSSYEVRVSRAGPSPRYSGYVELGRLPMDLGDRKDVMLHAVEDVVECLDTGRALESTGTDGVEALRIALAAHQSARMGERVSLRHETR